MAMFTLRLDDDLAARFDAVAASVGGRSTALRALIERVSRAPEAAAPASQPAPAMRSRGSNRVSVRLTDNELSQLDQAAAERGIKRTDWVAATVRSRLALTVPAQDDRERLIDIRIELRSIGNNVNQAVKALHVANMEGSRLDLEREAARVADFRATIAEQIEAIGAALKGDLAYWQGEA